MELDELTNCNPEDTARFQALAQALSLDEACEVAFLQRVEWLLSAGDRRGQPAQKAALEWLAYVLAVHQATTGKRFGRLPLVFDLPVFRSMRSPIHKGLIDSDDDNYPEEEEEDDAS